LFRAYADGLGKHLSKEQNTSGGDQSVAHVEMVGSKKRGRAPWRPHWEKKSAKKLMVFVQNWHNDAYLVACPDKFRFSF
jgi:hypothetical protein